MKRPAAIRRAFSFRSLKNNGGSRGLPVPLTLLFAIATSSYAFARRRTATMLLRWPLPLRLGRGLRLRRPHLWRTLSPLWLRLWRRLSHYLRLGLCLLALRAFCLPLLLLLSARRLSLGLRCRGLLRMLRRRLLCSLPPGFHLLLPYNGLLLLRGRCLLSRGFSLRP
jgi:hypothetical protein